MFVFNIDLYLLWLNGYKLYRIHIRVYYLIIKYFVYLFTVWLSGKHRFIDSTNGFYLLWLIRILWHSFYLIINNFLPRVRVNHKYYFTYVYVQRKVIIRFQYG
jgi:hypothetical protein